MASKNVKESVRRSSILISIALPVKKKIMNFFAKFVAFLCVCAVANGSPFENRPDVSKLVKAGFEFVGLVNGKVFLLPIERKYEDWFSAKTICHRAGYQMALVESAAEDEVVRQFTRSINGAGFYWMDATDMVERGDWHNSRSGESLSYFNWQSGRPSASDNRCMMWKQIDIQGPGSFWDVGCTDSNYALCEVSA